MTKPNDSVDSFRAAAARTPSVRYELCLFIAGTTPLSATGAGQRGGDLRRATRREVRPHGGRRCTRSRRARGRRRSFAIPTLLKKSPPPLRRLIGDLSDRGGGAPGPRAGGGRPDEDGQEDERAEDAELA